MLGSMLCYVLKTPGAFTCVESWNALQPCAQTLLMLVQDEIIEDPDNEFETDVDPKHGEGPRVINVGIPGPGAHVPMWKRAWRDKILPAIARFKPDIIFISAGFDAHRKDDINFRSADSSCCASCCLSVFLPFINPLYVVSTPLASCMFCFDRVQPSPCCTLADS